MRRTVRNTARRPLPTLVAVPSRASRNKPRSTEPHPLRRAGDITALTPINKQQGRTGVADARLMTDWPADKAWDNRVKRHLRSPVWYSKPYLLAALWGRLPSAPRE